MYVQAGGAILGSSYGKITKSVITQRRTAGLLALLKRLPESNWQFPQNFTLTLRAKDPEMDRKHQNLMRDVQKCDILHLQINSYCRDNVQPAFSALRRCRSSIPPQSPAACRFEYPAWPVIEPPCGRCITGSCELPGFWLLLRYMPG